MSIEEFTVPGENNSKKGGKKARTKKGLVIVNTGHGKGKTTAALGVMMRAWGRGMRVCMIQFIKAEKARFGEHRAAEKMGIEIISSGDGFVRTREEVEKSAENALRGWQLAQEKISSGEYDLLVLDEMTYCFKYGWIDLNDVKTWLVANKPSMMHLIITGRDASPELIDYADLVTEMKMVKHPYEKQEIGAQPGIEF